MKPAIDVSLLTQKGGMSYVGQLYMGESQRATVVYDTGSSYLTVTSAECDTTCKTRAYDFTKSPNAKLIDG